MKQKVITLTEESTIKDSRVFYSWLFTFCFIDNYTYVFYLAKKSISVFHYFIKCLMKTESKKNYLKVNLLKLLTSFTFYKI